MAQTLLYDGTFEGLLSSIYAAFYSKEETEEIVFEGDYLPNLVTIPIKVETDPIKSNKVEKAIVDKISREALEKVNYVYLSEDKNAGLAIYRYLRLGFRLGASVDLHVSNDVVLAMDKLAYKVKMEKHRLLGFVRFKSVGDFLYSGITPDHNVLTLITGHFTKRLPKERFIIHDLKRELAFFYNKGESVYVSMSRKEAEPIMRDRQDQVYEELWKLFFDTIAVEGRTNPRLQKGFMPVRYWKNLTEFKS